jgi:hypothetical protein
MSTTEERYARAINSSHLKVKGWTEPGGDAETLIAAGGAETLGVMLARLRAEWDTIHPTERLQAADDLTARVLVLMKLRTLSATKQAIYNFAFKQAARRGIDPKDAALLDLCGKVLDVWLDRKCHHCEGRGFNGGYREPQVHCRPCRGSGNRRLGTLHEVDALHHYGLFLLNVMDTKSTGAMGQINRKTRSNA